MGKRIIKIILCTMLCLLLVMGCAMTHAEEKEHKKVTVMVYMCGSDLEEMGNGTKTISKMYATQFNQKEVNALVLCGGAWQWRSSLDATVLSLVDVGRSSRRSFHVAEEMEKRSMGDPKTLASFLNLCYEQYPADSFVLVLWNHGGGPLSGVCFDDLFQHDSLTTADVAEALADSPFAKQKLDIIAMHACLMGSAEFAYSIAPYAKYYVASEDSQFGLDYGWLNGIEDVNSLETARKIVDASFQNNAEVIERQNESETNSFAVIDLAQMQAVRDTVNSFFDGFSAELSDIRFADISTRRRETQPFGLGESGGDSNFDLVDLGDLLRNYREYNPEKADAAEEALRNAVVYRRSVNENCSGMTVYHPYLAKGRVKERLGIYKDLGFSDNYYQYLLQFSAKLTDTPIAEWAGLQTETAYSEKTARTIYVLPLTDEQAAQYGTSSLKVLMKGEDDSYTFTFMSRNTSLKDGMVSGEYVKNVIHPVNEAGEILSEAVTYYLADGGEYIVPALLIHHETEDTGETEHKALISFRANAAGMLTPGSVRVWDESLGGYTSAFATTLADYDEIQLSFVSRKETRNVLDTLVDFDTWEVTDIRTWRRALDGSWSFKTMPESLDETRLYVTFEIQDSQNNLYCSDLKQVRDNNLPIQLDYDDLNLILVNHPSLQKTADNQIFSVTVTNQIETESIISLENLTVNGEALSLEMDVFGTGENWGLLQNEEQILMLVIPNSEVSGGTLKEMMFDLKQLDAGSDEEIGDVPVKVLFKQGQ